MVVSLLSASNLFFVIVNSLNSGARWLHNKFLLMLRTIESNYHTDKCDLLKRLTYKILPLHLQKVLIFSA